MKFKLLSDKIIHNAFFTIKEAIMDYDHFDGSLSQDVRRFAIAKGPAVGCIVHLYDIDKYVLIKQFRYPVTLLDKEDPWIWEIVAGVIDAGHTAEQTAVKELQEEAGYIAEDIKLVGEMWTSPGISSERIFIYLARAHSEKKVPKGDPHDDEEDIQVHVMNRYELKDLLQSGEIKDAKTLFAIQYVLLNQ